MANRQVITRIKEAGERIQRRQPIYFDHQTTPSVINFVNLPIVEQSAPAATLVPVIYSSGSNELAEEDTSTPTPTPTPIPIQSGSTNFPIVIGALAIIIVIILTWFFVGYLPSRSKGQHT
jgi:hypothetical protein